MTAASFNPIVAELGALPDRVAALLAGHAETALRRRPAPGEWSAKEIAHHLRDASRIYHERLQRTATAERPLLVAYDEAALAREQNYQELDTARILPELRHWRGQTVALMTNLPPEAWDRIAIHEEVGEMSLVQLAAHMIEHESDHLRGLRRLLGSKGFTTA
jgi:hypothetical protein